MKFEPILELPNAWTAVANRFGVHLFEGQCTVADMDRLQQAGDAWYRRHPGKLVELVIVYPSDNRMSSEERAKMTQLIKRWEAMRTASATVILADGLVGSLHRSVLTGLMMMAPAPHPVKVFAKVPSAVAFLAPHVQALGTVAPLETIEAKVAELCGRFESRARA